MVANKQRRNFWEWQYGNLKICLIWCIFSFGWIFIYYDVRVVLISACPASSWTTCIGRAFAQLVIADRRRSWIVQATMFAFVRMRLKCLMRLLTNSEREFYLPFCCLALIWQSRSSDIVWVKFEVFFLVWLSEELQVRIKSLSVLTLCPSYWILEEFRGIGSI